jgi:hypothetical protein
VRYFQRRGRLFRNAHLCGEQINTKVRWPCRWPRRLLNSLDRDSSCERPYVCSMPFALSGRVNGGPYGLGEHDEIDGYAAP